MDKKKEKNVDVREQLIENFNQVGNNAKSYLINNKFVPKEEDINIKNVIRYNKKIELTKKDSDGKEKDEFTLYVVELEYANPEMESENSLKEIEFLVEEDENGKIQKINSISDLIQEYEGFENIKDVVDKTKENEEKPKEEQDEEYKKDSLEELEAEKEKETEDEEKEIDEEEKNKNDLTGKKPKYVIQTVDIDNAYIDDWTTVRKGFGLPSGVEKIAVASPMQKDENILSSNMTVYMLDNKGNIVENVKGKTIKDYLEIDDATGNNPMYDDNTKIELEGYAEKNKGLTMNRFKSTKNPDLYLSVEQKRVGDYPEMYVGTRTRDGNDPVEVQLETNNVEIQTSLEMQKIVSGYKGIYNKEYIDKEADMHEEHGDDEMKIAIENADGLDYTKEVCESPYVPDTEITWEQLSKSLGDKNVDELQKEFFKQYDGNNSKKLILEMQEEYKEKEVKKPVEEKDIEEYEGRVPWDVTKH